MKTGGLKQRPQRCFIFHFSCIPHGGDREFETPVDQQGMPQLQKLNRTKSSQVYNARASTPYTSWFHSCIPTSRAADNNAGRNSTGSFRWLWRNKPAHKTVRAQSGSTQSILETLAMQPIHESPVTRTIPVKQHTLLSVLPEDYPTHLQDAPTTAHHHALEQQEVEHPGTPTFRKGSLHRNSRGVSFLVLPALSEVSVEGSTAHENSEKEHAQDGRWTRLGRRSSIGHGRRSSAYSARTSFELSECSSASWVAQWNSRYSDRIAEGSGIADPSNTGILPPTANKHDSKAPVHQTTAASVPIKAIWMHQSRSSRGVSLVP
jgi:hypothetical protein